MKQQLKAITAGVVAGLSALIPLMDNGLTPAETATALLAGIVGWQATYWIKNRD